MALAPSIFVFSLSIVGDLVTASPGLQLCTYSSLINESDTILSTFWPHQDKLPDDTCEDDHDHKEEEEVDDEEPFIPTRPPPRGCTAMTSRCTKSFHTLYVNQIGKVWEVTLIVALINSTHAVMMILLLKLSLRFLLSMICMMLKLI
jgi:hypothetical protein